MAPRLRQGTDFRYNPPLFIHRNDVAMPKITLTRWPAAAGQITINKIRARLEQEGLSPYRFEMVPGDVYGDHAHAEAEIRWVVSGRMRVLIDHEEIILEPGDRLDLAANVVHSADVFGEEVVVTLCASR
ncbi:MAG: cupin domain-containing protein [Nitrospirae bacterium]|nr:MAG: cupin domain-containing protein [Nitrospirota bacterium]